VRLKTRMGLTVSYWIILIIQGTHTHTHTHTHFHTYLPFTTFHLCNASVHLRWSSRWWRLWHANLCGCLKAWCHHLRWSCKRKRERFILKAYLCPYSVAQDLGMTPRILIHMVNLSSITVNAHLSLSTLQRNAGGMNVQLYSFLTIAQDGHKWLTLWSGRFVSATHWIGGWVGPRASLDLLRKIKISCTY